jgi:hypothetical protein
MSVTDQLSESGPVQCRQCGALADASFPPGTIPTCFHCRACIWAICVAFLVPVARWLLGIPWEGRHNSAHPLFLTEFPRFYDLSLFGFLGVDIAFCAWLVWYAAGLRVRFLALAIVQFLLCCFVVWGDFLWAGGPP